MTKDHIPYLKHIRDAIDRILKYTLNMSSIEFKEYDMVQAAVIRELQIIGEATKNLQPTIRKKYPDIPWREMAGMRDKLSHDYFGVDLDVVWDVVAIDLKDLLKKVNISIKIEESLNNSEQESVILVGILKTLKASEKIGYIGITIMIVGVALSPEYVLAITNYQLYFLGISLVYLGIGIILLNFLQFLRTREQTN